MLGPSMSLSLSAAVPVPSRRECALSASRPLFSVPTAPLVPILGADEGFPIHRIFCVGRNYAAHAAELGNTVDRVAPFYFTKPPTGLVIEGGRLHIRRERKTTITRSSW